MASMMSDETRRKGSSSSDNKAKPVSVWTLREDDFAKFLSNSSSKGKEEDDDDDDDGDDEGDHNNNDDVSGEDFETLENEEENVVEEVGVEEDDYELEDDEDLFDDIKGAFQDEEGASDYGDEDESGEDDSYEMQGRTKEKGALQTPGFNVLASDLDPDDNDIDTMEILKKKREVEAMKRKQKLFGAGVDEIFRKTSLQEEDDSPFQLVDDLSVPSFKARKKRRTIPPEVSKMIGEANMLFIYRDFEKAVSLLQNVVKIAPNVSDAYHILGLIYEEMGEMKKAITFFMIAAHLTPKDALLWKRIGQMSCDVQNYRQACYCLTKAIRLNKNDLESVYSRANIHCHLNQFKKAAEGYSYILKKHPEEISIVKELAKLYHTKLNMTEKAIELLESTLQTIQKSQDAQSSSSTPVFSETDELDIVNMIVELFMGLEQYEQADQLIQRVAEKREAKKPSSSSEREIPIDLSVNRGICQVYMGNLSKAETYLTPLLSILSAEGDTDKSIAYFYVDLIFQVAEAFASVENFARAAFFYTILIKHPSYNNYLIWLKMAQCHLSLSNLPLAETFASQVVQGNPECKEGYLILSEIYERQGKHDEATKIIDRSISSCLANSSASSQALAATDVPSVHYEEYSTSELAPSNPEPTFYDNALLPSSTDSQLLLIQAVWHSRSGEHSKILNYLPLITSDLDRIESLQSSRNQSSRTQSDDTKKKRKKRSEDQTTSEETGLLDYSSTRMAKQRKLSEDDFSVAPLPSLEAIVAESQPLEAKDISPEDPSTGVDALPFQEIATPAPEPQSHGGLLEILGEQKYYDVIEQLCRALAQNNSYYHAAAILKQVLAQDRFIDGKHREKLQQLSVEIAVKNGEYGWAYKTLRQICSGRPSNISRWNMFNALITKAGSLKSSMRFIFRQLLRFPDSRALNILVGHFCQMSSTHRFALARYLTAWELGKEKEKGAQEEGMINLCIGLAYLQLSLNKNTPDRHTSILQAFSFLFKYRDIRKEEAAQEAAFNIGRAFQHLGLFHLAIPCYEEILKTKAISHTDLNEFEDLYREAAYNLALIYQKSGSVEYARHLIRTHLTFN